MILTIDELRSRCEMDSASGCWNWLGPTNINGTPRMYALDFERVEKRALSGPRAAWQIAHQMAPLPGWLIFRRCGNKRCLNPVHLGQARSKAEIGAHLARLGLQKGKHLEQRRACAALAMAARGLTPTSRERVLEIRAADPAIKTMRLAKMLGMPHQTVDRIRKGLSHKHVTETPHVPV